MMASNQVQVMNLVSKSGKKVLLRYEIIPICPIGSEDFRTLLDVFRTLLSWNLERKE